MNRQQLMTKVGTMSLRIWILLFLILAALVFPVREGCSAEETRQEYTLLNHCLFPLENGAEWKYQAGAATWTCTIISLSATPNSKIAILAKRTPVEQIVAEIKSELSLRANCVYEKILAMGAAGIATPGVDLDIAGMLLPDLQGLRRGHSWPINASLKIDVKIAEFQAAAQPTCQVEGWEWVTVPAGTFYALKLSTIDSPLRGESVVRLLPKEKREKIDVPAGGASYDWYAPFVGLVKSLGTDPGEGGTIELLSTSLKPSPCDVAVISLDGKAKINGRLPQAEIIRGENIDIETDAGSTLEICQPDQTLTRIGPETKIQLSTPCNPEESPGGPKAPPTPIPRKVAVLLGKLWATVSKASGGGKVRYETPSVTIGPRGTKLSIEVKPDGSTIVEVEEGEVEVSEKKTGEMIILRPGEHREFLMAPET